MNVFFLVPGRVWIVFNFHWVPNRQRTLPGKSHLSVLEPSAVIRISASSVNTFFSLFHRAMAVVPAREARRASVTGQSLQRFRCSLRFAVCVENSVPVASTAWHAQVWVKVLAR